jgi:signal peptidase I
MLVKIFVFEIAKVTGQDMESTYKPGTTFLINKLAGSYYTNDIVYFRFPDVDSTLPKTWCLQRIIGLPGDTIEMKSKHIYINNYPINDTSSLKFNYFVKSKSLLDSSFLQRYGLTEGGSISADNDYSFSLTNENAHKVRNDSSIQSIELKLEQRGSFDETVFPHSTVYNWNMDYFGKLYIPKKHDTLEINLKTVILYSRLITFYEKNRLEIKGDTILINNKPAKKYEVKRNYYFVLGDNRDNANDSRVFGLLPEHYIKGKVIAILKKVE